MFDHVVPLQVVTQFAVVVPGRVCDLVCERVTPGDTPTRGETVATQIPPVQQGNPAAVGCCRLGAWPHTHRTPAPLMTAACVLPCSHPSKLCWTLEKHPSCAAWDNETQNEGKPTHRTPTPLMTATFVLPCSTAAMRSASAISSEPYLHACSMGRRV